MKNILIALMALVIAGAAYAHCWDARAAGLPKGRPGERIETAGFRWEDRRAHDHPRDRRSRDRWDHRHGHGDRWRHRDRHTHQRPRIYLWSVPCRGDGIGLPPTACGTLRLDVRPYHRHPRW